MGNDTELNILIKAKNEASKVFNDVKSDAAGFGSGMKNALDDAKGASLALMGVVAAGAVGVGAFGVSSVNAYMDAQNAVSQLEAVLKSTGGAAGVTSRQLQEQATALQGVTKFSDEAVMATQSMLLTFTAIKGPVLQGATQAALDMAQALGMDGAQAAMQLGKALNDPAAGMAKLQRVGVTFTDQQKAQAAQMVAVGDVAGAQTLILNELSKEFGGSAVAAGKTFSGQLEILKNTFGDLQEAVGQAILTALQPFFTAMQEVVFQIDEAGGIMPWLTTLFKDNAKYISIAAGAIAVGLVPALFAMAAGIWAAVAPLIPFLAVGAALGAVVYALAQQAGGFGALWSNITTAAQEAWAIIGPILIPAFQQLWNVISTQLWPALQNLWTVLSPVLIPALQALGIIIVALIVGGIWLMVNVITVAIQAVTWLINKFAEMGAFVGGIINMLMPMFSAFAAFLGPVFQFIGLIAISTFQYIWTFISGVFSGIIQIIQGFVGMVGNQFGLAVAIITGNWNAVPGYFRGIVSSIGQVFGGVASIISAPFRAAFNAIASFWNNTVGTLNLNIPGWVPGIGGRGFSFPKIPMMAEGGIVSSPTLAMIGEGRGPEAVVPLNKIGQFMKDAGGGAAPAQPMQVHFNGNVDLNSEAAVDRMFDRLERMNQKAQIGAPI